MAAPTRNGSWRCRAYYKIGELEANVTSETYARNADTGVVVFAYLPLGPVAELRRAGLELKMNHTLRA